MRAAFSQAVGLPDTGATELLHDIDIIEGLEESGEIDSSQIESGKLALMKILSELAEELSRSINFYVNQSEDLEIAQLLLAGPGAGLSQVDEFFTEKLNLPTMKIDPIATLNLNVDRDIAPEARPGLGIVLGLGMRDA